MKLLRTVLVEFFCQLFYLVGAGLADPDGVLVEPFVFVADDVPTDSREGLEGVVDVVTRRVGIRVCVPSSNQTKGFVTQFLSKYFDVR